MGETALVVSQSKYFTPAFNTAIFDGSVRIYFAQHQEDEALHFYFNLQNQMKEDKPVEAAALEGNEPGAGALPSTFHSEGNVFVMLYPNADSFRRSFDVDANYAFEKVGDDLVLGIQSDALANGREQLYAEVFKLFESPSLNFI